MSEQELEFQESTSVTFEWTLKGLKHLFESTKGEHKSKVTKSPLFGGGRWQILFYANSGLPKDGGSEGNYVSLYLACEPTFEEKESALSNYGRWVREGVYKFSFELRKQRVYSLSKTITYNSKEAHNHTFSHKNANWGWAQFTRRDAIFYQAQNVRSQDALVIVCTITSSPYVPPRVPSQPHRCVPKGLIDTVGALLDDPLYSDVEFIIPRGSSSLRDSKHIWASRRILQRAEYFDAMFGSSFAEGSLTGRGPILTTTASQTLSTLDKGFTNYFDDSDQEDEDAPEGIQSLIDEDDPEVINSMVSFASSTTSNEIDVTPVEGSRPDTVAQNLTQQVNSSSEGPIDDIPPDTTSTSSSKLRVIVRDTAYSTYRAVLFYLYTDSIVFAPLSSSFTSSDETSPIVTSANTSVTALDVQGSSGTAKKSTKGGMPPAVSRKEWIQEWCSTNPGRPVPCSAKAVYRLADRIGLMELKERAAQHIYNSLSVNNIPYEVFSAFSATYDEIRKVLVDYFLSHWDEVRISKTMKTVWQQIRNGRHPGFEEVWPVIAQSLEFKPSNPSNTTSSEEFPRLSNG
ncbi:hypothetical protein AMATHDRAFT_136448 [Amanita thiersii Skay4041]|uniref:MATH domain-containing protein n=1 Tax=Amanita thiersii Skay4041 TaxID=703135 RepID=A0A2A9P0F1_9AGAR|nr:hypothetical protein AMATHDRAFT_136448 [Amanita thiersii Skay4041]